MMCFPATITNLKKDKGNCSQACGNRLHKTEIPDKEKFTGEPENFPISPRGNNFLAVN
jgi:hypothetical protein